MARVRKKSARNDFSSEKRQKRPPRLSFEYYLDAKFCAPGRILERRKVFCGKFLETRDGEGEGCASGECSLWRKVEAAQRRRADIVGGALRPD
jgi:hypothetical protein